MVRRQLRDRGITDERVLAAMGTVPRERFVDPEDIGHAYSDGALGIGHSQTISQPWVVASIGQALALGPQDVALEIGAGSGYSTAVLAMLCESVLAYEIVPELCDLAGERLAGLANVEVRCGDGADAPAGPYDAIAIHAAMARPPDELLERLVPGGRLVAPVRRGLGEVLTCFTRRRGRYVETEIAQVRFVPLTGRLGS